MDIITNMRYALKTIGLPGHDLGDAYQQTVWPGDNDAAYGKFGELRSMPGTAAASSDLQSAIRQASQLSREHGGQTYSVEHAKDGALELRPVMWRQIDPVHVSIADELIGGASFTESRKLSPFVMDALVQPEPDPDYGVGHSTFHLGDIAKGGSTKALVTPERWFDTATGRFEPLAAK